ncbi:ABC transporter ATP-binding protein [Paracoccus suum]|uniref:ABC transporter ATP-binding protein n=1 Tax=Paracoccus suum TaxID=2259340 RepID=A0A344PMH2_9RHOB|nr:ABC transporter ATP-binding protein [Paracoccus suum]AXC50577.1 ABC transporter ATP-binding protein [Paracoccus suum]
MVTLSLQDVGARFGRREVLSQISVPCINGGGLTAVVGPNAAGKSTLFRRIAGIMPGSGRVHVAGASRGGICYMPQDTAANAVLTVFESILLAARGGSGRWRVSEAELARIDQVMALLNIVPLAFRNLGELSGGQRQLVSLAQVLIREPDVLLMDEPTSALDLHRQIEVLELVQGLAAESGMVAMVALHDLNQALRYCDQTLVIADGRLKAAGLTHEVVTEAMLASTYAVAARIERCRHGRPQLIVDGALHDEHGRDIRAA